MDLVMVIIMKKILESIKNSIKIKYWCEIDDCYEGCWSLKALFMRLFCWQDRVELEYKIWKIVKMRWVDIIRIWWSARKYGFGRGPLRFWGQYYKYFDIK